MKQNNFALLFLRFMLTFFVILFMSAFFIFISKCFGRENAFMFFAYLGFAFPVLILNIYFSRCVKQMRNLKYGQDLQSDVPDSETKTADIDNTKE